MKTFFRSLAVIMLFLSVDTASFAGKGPEIELNEPRWEFGRVIKGEIKEKTFEVRNSGDADLVIGSVKACCGYGIADIDRWALKPGESARIKVTSDTSRKSIGKDEKYITIFSNSALKPEFGVAVVTEIADARQNNHVKVPVISPEKLHNLISSGKKVLMLDVREESEFSEKHIPGAVNYPRSRMADMDRSLGEITRGTEEGTVISVNCGVGARSSYVAAKLKDMGYNAFNLEGGLKAWENAGYDLLIGPKTPSSMMPIEIGPEEAYEHYYLIFGEKVLWVDVRNNLDFAEAHVRGARNIEIHKLEGEMGSLAMDKDIILYCYGPECEEASAAGKLLIEKGYKQGKVRVMTAGFKGWEEAGYPVEK